MKLAPRDAPARRTTIGGSNGLLPTPKRLLASLRAPGEHHELEVVRGRGVRVTLSNGHEVIDAGSMSSCLVGHCHPEVVEAIQAAATRVYVGDMVDYAARDAAVADLLDLGFAGEDWAASAGLFVSSSEAADLGLTLAQMLSGRAPLVCRSESYHGSVGLARAVSHNRRWDASLESLDGERVEPPPLAPVRVLPVPPCGGNTVRPDHDWSTAYFRNVRRLLRGAAAVIMDYSQGGVVPSAHFQDQLAVIAREAGVLWIADETVTGFGRLGSGFAFQRGSTRPDMVTLGKGLTGGAVPGGALVLSSDVIRMIGGRRWLTSSTFRGNPLTVAAMSAVLRVLARERLTERAARLGTVLSDGLDRLARRHPSVEAVIGEGLLWFIRLRPPGRTGLDRNGDIPVAPLVTATALEHGVLVPHYTRDTVWLVPPLIISEADLSTILEVLDTALDVADNGLDETTER